MSHLDEQNDLLKWPRRRYLRSLLVLMLLGWACCADDARVGDAEVGGTWQDVDPSSGVADADADADASNDTADEMTASDTADDAELEDGIPDECKKGPAEFCPCDADATKYCCLMFAEGLECLSFGERVGIWVRFYDCGCMDDEDFCGPNPVVYEHCSLISG